MKNKPAFSNNFFQDIDMPPVLKQAYLPSLDGLRAIAVLMVIIAHTSQRFINKGDHFDAFTKLGDLGVHFFFVISGFLITMLLIKERYSKGFISLKNFYIKRFFRILPLAYLYIIVLILLAFFFNKTLLPKDIVGASLFVFNFPYFRIGGNNMIGHFWSLAVEEQFYILYPVLLFKSYRLNINPIIKFVVLLVITTLVSKIYFGGQLNFYSPYISIFFGCLLSYFTATKYKYIKRIFRCPTIVNFISIIIVFSLTIFPLHLFVSQVNSDFIASIIIDIAVCAIIITNIRPGNGVIFKILNLAPLKLTGKYSYSLYIWQQLFTKVILWGTAFKYAGSIVFNIILLIIVSFISFNYFENPIRNLKNKFI
jgi:peptidoglycan/LPS O-acetylase OafA/YrhL